MCVCVEWDLHQNAVVVGASDWLTGWKWVNDLEKLRSWFEAGLTRFVRDFFLLPYKRKNTRGLNVDLCWIDNRPSTVCWSILIFSDLVVYVVVLLASSVELQQRGTAIERQRLFSVSLELARIAFLSLASESNRILSNTVSQNKTWLTKVNQVCLVSAQDWIKMNFFIF